MPKPVSPLEDVSRETLEKLHELESLAIEWNSKINLVSKNTIPDFWNRHILDSAQLFQQADSAENWCDLGSGGGFPGLVIGLMQLDLSAPTHISLVESDKRKCAFLQTAIRKLSIPGKVYSQRIEDADVGEISTLSARALAPLDKLLGFSERILGKSGHALFPKGKSWKNEVISAQEKWSFELDVVQSITDPEAVILRISGIERRT